MLEEGDFIGTLNPALSLKGEGVDFSPPGRVGVEYLIAPQNQTANTGQKVGEWRFEVGKGDDGAGLGLGDEGADALHIDLRVELFSEEGKDGGNGSDVHGPPKGGEQFLAVLHDEDDQIVVMDVVVLQRVGGSNGRLPELGAGKRVCAAVFFYKYQRQIIRLAGRLLFHGLN